MTLVHTLTPAEARTEFEVTRLGTYLDVAARAPMSDRVARELQRYIEDCRREGAPKQAWLARVEDVRHRMARFLSASDDEIAFVKNTSDGLNIVAHGLGLGRGDNVVICPELEHGNNVYVWLNLRAQGVEVRTIPADHGEISLERLREAIDDRTRVVSVSSVSFISGARADLQGISELAHRKGALLVVDAAQELGAVGMDPRSLGIDALAAPIQKSVLATYGLGILYLRSELLEQVTPVFLSRIGVDLGPSGHYSDLGELGDYQVRKTAAKFEIGNYNFAGVFALDAALSLLEDVGMDVVEDHVLALTARIIDGLDALGFEPLTPRLRTRHAGIIAFQHPDPPRLLERLEQRQIRLSVRRGWIRPSVHVYNDDDDVSKLLEVLAETTRRPS
jgi:cysteine desulfurase/selenocysteine lyase